MSENRTSTDTNAERPTVLIVEDERDLCDLYATWLADTCVVRTAYSGREALSKLDETVDVVLLDRRTPRISGDEVLSEIRDRGLDCRVVIVSAVTPDFDVVGMGFDDYLVKPVEGAELRGVVERMYRRSTYDEALQELRRLAATKATLAANKSPAELDSSEEYAALEGRIAELRTAADSLVDDFAEDDFAALIRDLDREAADRGLDDEPDDDR